MDEPKDNLCEYCMYWEKILESAFGNCGYCHRNPHPRVERPMRANYEPCPFPITLEAEWCGEFQKIQ